MKSTVKRARERERERERFKIKSAEKSPEIKGLRKTQRVKEDYLSETVTKNTTSKGGYLSETDTYKRENRKTK